MVSPNNGGNIEPASEVETQAAKDDEPKPGGSEGSEAPPCFIATAVYGTGQCHELDVFRKFRDQHLMTNCIGRQFVAFYYRVGPSMAERLKTQPRVKIILKPIFDTIFRFLK